MKKILHGFRVKSLFLLLIFLTVQKHYASASHLNNSSYTSYKDTISVNFQGEDLSSAIKIIGKKSGLNIVLNNNDFTKGKKVFFKADALDVTKILSAVLKDTGVSYRIQNKTIILYSRNSTSQINKIEGQLFDQDNGDPLVGASVQMIQGDKGAITDFDGNFILEVPEFPVRLRFSYLGYESKEIEVVGTQTELMVHLTPLKEALSEVVVTALGITRDEKSLGYAVGQLSDESMNETRRTNLSNAMAGKIAGVQVRNISPDPASSALITIRGQSSINGDNQPLFVIDGIPVSSNNQNSASAGEGYVDYGNTSLDISTDDIENVSVLKGAAAALYGSRAANGVILITTKKGRGHKKGLGVSYTSSFKLDNAWLYPDFQNDFAAGSDIASVDENGVPIATGSGTWGPRITSGRLAVQSMPGGGTEISALQAYPDRHKDFFQNGYTLSNNIAVTGNYDKGSFRLSMTRLNNEGIVPGTDYDKSSFNLNSDYLITDDLKVSVMANFSLADSDNRPTQGKSGESDNPTEVVYRSTPNTNLGLYEDYWADGLVGIQQKTMDGGDNPYFTAFEQKNEFERNRLFGKVQLNYVINPYLSVQLRSGIDTYNEQRITKRAFSSNEYPSGAYGNRNIGFTEINSDVLVTFNPNIENELFDMELSVGANRLDQENKYASAMSDQLEVANFYNISNAAGGSVVNSDGYSKKRINSTYALLQASYKDILFLDASARNDWSSTLPENNNSYFYPSASMSFLFSEAFQLNNNWFSFGKARFSWSEVGNDTSPYQLTNSYGFSDWGEVKLASNSTALRNNNLKPEKTRGFEGGLDVRFFKNRLGLDITYYNTKTFNQIISLPIAISSGGSSKVINAGEIQNKGWEVTLNATPIKNASFNWDLSANYSKNKNVVNSLYDGIESMQIGSATGVYQYLYIGGEVGDFYDSRTPLRVEDGVNAGRFILEDGMFIRNNSWTKIGNANPDFTVGLTNIFNYKNFRLAFTLDWRQGGEFYNYTAKNLMSDGRTGFTVPFRDEQSGGIAFSYEGEQRTDGAIIPGVVQNEDGSYSENTQALPASLYYGEYWDYEEFHMSSATFVKLRELSLGYTFTSIKPFQRVSIDLIGTDLLSWFAYKTKENTDGFVIGDYDHGYDPEMQNYLSSDGPLGITSGVGAWQLPATRSYGIKLGLTF